MELSKETIIIPISETSRNIKFKISQDQDNRPDISIKKFMLALMNTDFANLSEEDSEELLMNSIPDHDVHVYKDDNYPGYVEIDVFGPYINMTLEYEY